MDDHLTGDKMSMLFGFGLEVVATAKLAFFDKNDLLLFCELVGDCDLGVYNAY